MRRRDEKAGGRVSGVVNPFLQTDPGLLRGFRDGDREILARVYREYVGSVAQAVSRALRRYDYHAGGRPWRRMAVELPDLVQEVFVRAFAPETRRRFDGARDYGPYLCQIARNVVVDHLRGKRRQARIVEVPDQDAPPLHAPWGEHLDALEHSQTVAIVARYVAQLSPELRRVHEALYVVGMSQREAADALGLGRQVVRTLEGRLREGLRDALDSNGQPTVPAALAEEQPMAFPGDGRVR